MRDDFAIEHVFVDRVPPDRKERMLYVSVEFGTAIHSCMCGCGTKIVTPLSPAQWQMLYDGDTVTLWPSIGNSRLPCKSHYWIKKDRVVWAPPLTTAQIARGVASDRQLRDVYYDQQGRAPENKVANVLAKEVPPPAPVRVSFGQWLRDIFGLKQRRDDK